ncbi:hypothetical protein KMW28_18510 [Flammeovirga yaeyamensis]|uniref:Lipocalin-like domain-containing protein n=1 Tax=Flammeovirga yaeyamensis TaxID=367791 RepID=A0AAX1N2G0_9BACT|nr:MULTISPECIES: hypothetical protein [Flammeovirga]ANQ50967.1 hypothetical protein MY04_3619 [Flammeovirga sp. MY04]MBB3701154.1 hypothetical protein [Flammeovirga yaeyamensis]NMF38379.1 hypothetical protein [Flammeovirga yaeyamensis]QWG01620.1 hypothetical protein KMW28_18510 [Flammeovirga yaeyamensis]
MKKLISITQVLIITTCFSFISCENAELANTANAVAGNYQITNISAKTNQGQATVQHNPEFDKIIISATDERTVKIDVIVTTAKVSIGTSNANLLQTIYHDVSVEGNNENNTFTLTKTINMDNNATLVGHVNSNSELMLEYKISGTELFSITAYRP